MTPFFRLPAPYIDAALIGFADPASAEMGAARLRGGLAGIGFQVVGSGAHLLVSGAPPARGLVFSGLGKIGGRLVFGQDDLPAQATDLGGEIGQFTALSLGSERCMADNDLFGFGHLFGSQHQGCAIVSNRLHLHRLVMAALGLPLELDRGAALSLLFSNATFFSQQPISTQTLIRGVTQVPLDRRPVITGGALRLEPKREFLACLEPGPYEDLLEAGAAEVIENTRAALECSRFRDVIVDLSGGKDSRLVFGSMLHVPGWRERIRLHTLDVAGSRDLDIACGIASLFGAQFYDGSSLPRQPFSVEQNIGLWRSYFHGLYHRMGAAAWTYAGANTEALTISGGHGETLRSFWVPQYQHVVNAGCGAKGFAARLAADTGLRSVFDRGVEREVAGVLEQALEALPAGDLAGALDLHYLYHRNRAHFGLRGFSTYHERPTWFPLQSPSLFRAAWSLTHTERAAGRLVHDLMRRLHPILPQIELDGAPAAVDGIGHAVALRLPLDCRRDAWAAATETAKARLAEAQAGQAAMSWRAWPASVEAEAIRAYEEARRQDVVPPTYVDAMRAAFRAEQRKAYEMASRLMAIRDSLGD